MPDYTPQLEKIIARLSQPGPSPWLLATFSVAVGVLAATLGHLLQPILSDINRRKRMRRVVYTDVQYIYARIEAFLEASDESNRDWVMHEVEEVKGFLNSRNEKYANDNRDVLLQLHEHGAVEHFYRECRKLTTDLTSFNCKRVLRLVAFYLAEGDLEERYFIKFLPKAQAKNFIERVRRRHAQYNRADEDALNPQE
jgi:hypothetical protein